MKKSIIAFAFAAIILAASIIVPMAGNACEEGQVVGYFLDDVLEGS